MIDKVERDYSLYPANKEFSKDFKFNNHWFHLLSIFDLDQNDLDFNKDIDDEGNVLDFNDPVQSDYYVIPSKPDIDFNHELSEALMDDPNMDLDTINQQQVISNDTIMVKSKINDLYKLIQEHGYFLMREKFWEQDYYKSKFILSLENNKIIIKQSPDRDINNGNPRDGMTIEIKPDGGLILHTWDSVYSYQIHTTTRCTFKDWIEDIIRLQEYPGFANAYIDTMVIYEDNDKFNDFSIEDYTIAKYKLYLPKHFIMINNGVDITDHLVAYVLNSEYLKYASGYAHPAPEELMKVCLQFADKVLIHKTLMTYDQFLSLYNIPESQNQYDITPEIYATVLDKILKKTSTAKFRMSTEYDHNLTPTISTLLTTSGQVAKVCEKDDNKRNPNYINTKKYILKYLAYDAFLAYVFKIPINYITDSIYKSIRGRNMDDLAYRVHYNGYDITDNMDSIYAGLCHYSDIPGLDRDKIVELFTDIFDYICYDENAVLYRDQLAKYIKSNAKVGRAFNK